MAFMNKIKQGAVKIVEAPGKLVDKTKAKLKIGTQYEKDDGRNIQGRVTDMDCSDDEEEKKVE
jgi:hypothetical protein